MLELLSLYKWTIGGGIIGGGFLAIVGGQLAARNQAVQTLVISQAATFGTVVGLAINILWKGDHAHWSSKNLSPLIASFVLAAAFYLICESIVSQKVVSKNTYYIGIFSLLMSLTYTLMALIPSLETNMATSYFGDLTVTSNLEAGAMIAIGAVGIAFFGFKRKSILAWSFDFSTFGSPYKSEQNKRTQTYFLLLALIAISTSIQFLGLLFTLLCLFLPAIVLSRTAKSLRYFTLKTLFSTALGVGLGFLFSLWQGHIPTVPTIGLALPLATFLVHHFYVAKD
jgi:zinc/manganese transport system permease protein/iron/zinc/copper transport system permease protein